MEQKHSVNGLMAHPAELLGQLLAAVDGSQASVQGASSWVLTSGVDGDTLAMGLQRAMAAAPTHTQRLHRLYVAHDLLCRLPAQVAAAPLHSALCRQLPALVSATLQAAGEGAERAAAVAGVAPLVDLWASRGMVDASCHSALRGVLAGAGSSGGAGGLAGALVPPQPPQLPPPPQRPRAPSPPPALASSASSPPSAPAQPPVAPVAPGGAADPYEEYRRQQQLYIMQ